MALIVLVSFSALVVGNVLSVESEATGIPGEVGQSSSDVSAGVVIDAHKANFSGSSVEVELSADAVSSRSSIVSVSPIDAAMNGVSALSAYHHRDGTTLMRFPAEAWPESEPTVVLSIRRVSIFKEGAGFDPLSGEWDLTIQAPEGQEAQAARAVETLDPVEVEIGGHEITIETVITPTSSVIRLDVPEEQFASFPAPTLRAGDLVVEPRVSERRGEQIEHRYGPVSPGAALTLEFNGVVAVEPVESPWVIELAIEPEPIPPRTGDISQVEELDWQVISDGAHPEVRDVVLERVGDDAELAITFDGSSWRPGPTPPVVAGDGERMEVHAAGFSIRDGQPESNMSITLDDEELPETVTVTAVDQEIGLPSTEIVLRPG